MTNHTKFPHVGAETGALACTLLLGTAALAPAMAAAPAAEDPAVTALTRTSSSVEIGVGRTSDNSYKFGEYNGLDDKGGFGVASFDLRGGGDYDSADKTRWRVAGSNLGLSSRSLFAEFGSQGRFQLNLSYDSLRRNRSDSYVTPYVGAGTAVQTLPSTWIVPVVPRVSTTAANARGLLGSVTGSSALVTGVLTPPTAAQLTQATVLQAADLPSFHSYGISTTRERIEAGAKFLATPKWSFAVNARQDNRDGAKLMGTVTRATGGDISSILADPIDQRTDQFLATAAYKSKKDFLQFSYSGSQFRNNVSSLTWTNWANPAVSSTMSSAPDNQAHQFTATGGHDFTTSTRLVANLSYGRNTQNGRYLTDASTPLVPATSLDGRVILKGGTLKLTSRPGKSLSLGLGYKFDERDNQTPVRIFGYYDANEAAGAANINAAFATALGQSLTTLKSNTNVNANRPYSRRLNQVTADADWRYTPGQTLKASAEWQKQERWCDGSWINCVNAANTTDKTAKLEWLANPTALLTARVAVSMAQRDVGAYNNDAFLALVPLANVSPSTATGGATAYSYMTANGLTAYGPTAGYLATTGNANLFFPLNNQLANATYGNQNRISEILGLRVYDQADRKRNRVSGALDWQAATAVSLHADGSFHKDYYDQSRYGLIELKDWTGNFEVAYTPHENLAMTAYYTRETRRANSAGNTYTANSAAANVNGFTAISGGCYATIALRNASNKIDSCLDWRTEMTDSTRLYGLSVNRSNLLAGKLNLGLQFVRSQAHSDNIVTGGNYVNNPLAVTGAAVGTTAAYYIRATPLPNVVSDSSEFRLNARYMLDASSALRLAYIYGDLSASDYAYEGMQYGGLAGVLPSGETAPRYIVHVITLSYTRKF